MRILVTGASGFLGGWLLMEARRYGKTVGLYNSFPIPVQQTYSVDLVDEKRLSRLLSEVSPTLIIHNAAYANPDLCEQNKALALAINVEATRTIVQWCKENHCRLVYTSTDLVFDGERGNYTEEDQPSPTNYYGITKAQAEQLVLELAPDALVCRLALMYGRGRWRRPYSTEWLERELLRRQQQPTLAPLPLFTDQYRSMIAVGNAAALLLEAATKPINGILHIGAPQSISRYQFGVLLCQHFGFSTDYLRPVKSSEISQPLRRPRDVSLNVRRAQQLLTTPLLDIKSGITKAFSMPRKGISY